MTAVHITLIAILTALTICCASPTEEPSVELVSECIGRSAITTAYQDDSVLWRDAELCEFGCEMLDGFASCNPLTQVNTCIDETWLRQELSNGEVYEARCAYGCKDDACAESDDALGD